MPSCCQFWQLWSCPDSKPNKPSFQGHGYDFSTVHFPGCSAAAFPAVKRVQQNSRWVQSGALHEVEQEGAALQAGGALRGDTARLATGLRCSPVPPPARPRPTDPLGVLRAHTAPAHLAASRETSAAQRGAGLALEGAWLRLATPPPRARGAEWGQPG